MTQTIGSDARLESYLAQVRVALRGLPEGEIEDILRELRSHIAESAGDETQAIESTLKSLGDPLELARTYRTANQLVQAECSGSPLVILQGVRYTTRSGLGRITATALYIFGYIIMGTLWAAALDKLFAPSQTGLYYTPRHLWSLTLVTDGSHPAGARELLGWWLVPVCVALGWIVRSITDRIAQWWIKRYRRLHPRGA